MKTYQIRYSNVKTTTEQQDEMFVLLSGVDYRTLKGMIKNLGSPVTGTKGVMMAKIASVLSTGHYNIIEVK